MLNRLKRINMNTIMITYNPNNKVVRGLIDILSNIRGVQLKRELSLEEKTELEYNKEFVEKIDRSLASKGRKIKFEDLWKL